MVNAQLPALIASFRATFDSSKSDNVWRDLSGRFRRFWTERIMGADAAPISDDDCDAIISMLDRSAKGNTKESHAVARAMVPQGAWRRMLNEFHQDRRLGGLVDRVLSAEDPNEKATLIDELYKFNANRRNNLTGPSGNTVGALLAAHDPVRNLSVISLKDRRAIAEHFGVEVGFDWNTASIGTRMAVSNEAIIRAMRKAGLDGTARTISRFFYSDAVKPLWRGEHTVNRADKAVAVVVPTSTDDQDTSEPDPESVRESMQIQGLLAKIGTSMGFTIWLPRGDRSRVLKVWNAQPGELLDQLPLGYDSTTMKTVEQIDVLWLRKRSIVRAFEVEHTTSVYSGLLRMADLVALQPNINVKLHIVAPPEKREKVLDEIKRPVFSLLEGRALSEMCTYLSYEDIREIGASKHLLHLSDSVLEEYAEQAESHGHIE